MIVGVEIENGLCLTTPF